MTKAIWAALLSGVLYLFAATGHAWPLAWIAPIPVLWFAFGRNSLKSVASLAFCAYLVGEGFLFYSYWSALPLPILVGAGALGALCYAGVVLLSRFVVSRISTVPGVLAFPAIMVTWEFVV